MGDKSAIEWTDATWNPWQGCHHVSAGCEHCYMFREKRQYGQDPDVVIRSKPRTFNLPLRLKEPMKVFTCSWSDFFIKEADPWRDEAWELIRRTPHLTYLILTKRIGRAQKFLPWGDGEPWPHVWGIVSAEDQPTADARIPQLLRTNFAGRGLSAEPLLGPMDLDFWLRPYEDNDPQQRSLIDWVIVGGESGGTPERALVTRYPVASGGKTDWSPKPEALEWVRSIKRQCLEADVPFFFKQWGGPTPKSGGRLLDEMEWSEYPERSAG